MKDYKKMKIENNIQLIGTIATDIKLINSQRGQYSFAKLAVANEYKDKMTNQTKEFIQFIPISFYGEEKIKKTKELTKGDKLLICGSIFYSSYLDQNKAQKTYFSVVCEKFEIISQQKQMKESKTKEIKSDDEQQEQESQENGLKRIEDVFSFDDMEDMFNV